MVRHNKIQLQVLNLYRRLLKAAEAKPSFKDNIKFEFRKNSKISKTNTLRIEHLLRDGERKLKMIKDPHVDGMGRFV